MVPLTPFFKMFGQSPIRPLQAHMAKVQNCAMALLPFFEAVFVQDWDRAHGLQEQISQLEREADEIKKDLRLHMPKDLFLPVSRTDLLETLAIQDQIANQAKDIAGVVYGRQMLFPDVISEFFFQLLKRSLDASKQAQTAINELDDLLETGFRGNEVRIMEEMIIELDRLEHETDEIQVSIRQILFKLEKSLSPIDVIFLYKIIEWTGALADHAHHVGGQLQLLLAR